uniref:Uncharacterized protein n=1 Tax=Populus trichocarpa TaxID=3694 RepID=A0A2K1YWI0_POPTR
MATRSLWRTRGKLAVAATVASSEDPETALKLCTAVPVRLYLDTVTAQTPSIAFDNEGVNAENKFLRMIKRVRFSRKSLKRHLVATIDKFIVHVARTHDGQKLSVRHIVHDRYCHCRSSHCGIDL